MSLLPEPHSVDREIARALLGALEPVLQPMALAAGVISARDAAQLLSLAGLDRLLSALQPHASTAWPEEMIPAFERLKRLAAEAESAGSIDPFRNADRELDSLAAQLQSLEWSETSIPGVAGRVRIPTLRLTDVIEDVATSPSSREALRLTRLTAPVAAALRAALDWLAEENPTPAPLRITAEDSVLEIAFDRLNESGLWAASQVLDTAGGNLGPTHWKTASQRPEGPWRLRVPAAASRPSYLMMIQGGISVAIPWHAVLRICMVPAAGLDRELRNLEYPALAPLTELSCSEAEHPVALVAHALKRANFVADRLIWRLEADPVESPGPAPLEGLTRAVRTDEGELFWIAEPAWLLDAIESPAIPAPRRSPSAAQSEGAGLPMLGADDVEPLDIEPLQEVVAIAEAEAPILRPTPADERPRVLIADDSIGARVQLMRILEPLGFEVESVGTARDLSAALARDRWTLVFVDVELPNAHGHELLAATLVAQPSGRVVALVRDDMDHAVAQRAGVTATLRKPFDPESTTLVLRELGLIPEEKR